MEVQETQHGDGHDAQIALVKSTPNDGDTYRMMVLRFDRPEEEVDEELVQTALDLGIDVSRSPSPKSSIADMTEDIATLEVDPALSEPPGTPDPSIQSSSQTSGSSNAQSDSSMEYKRHTKTPSFTATSITSVPSITSTSSQLSNRARVRKGIRRLSTLRRRKPSDSTTPPPATPNYPARPASRLQQSVITEHALSMPHLQPHALTTNETTNNTNRSGHVSSASSIVAISNVRTPDLRPHEETSPSQSPRKVDFETQAPPDLDIAPPPSPATLEAQYRSLNHPILQKLRTSQRQDQLRFISFQASQSRLKCTAHLQAKRTALSAYKAHQFHLETTHAEALVSLEQRHLDAEVDLRKGLEGESKACDVKLRHMQAYCNPRSHVEGMPRREVTKADYRQLEQQYHVRNTMDNLHTSKINVLREKQGKQLERIMGKQQAGLEKAEADFEQENIDLDQQFREEDENLSEEFRQRRKRLVRRWRLMENIERRKLEVESGEEFGQMPDVPWKEEDLVTARRKDIAGSALSASETGDEAQVNILESNGEIAGRTS